MTRAWDSDDKIFVLVLMAAVISQTATNKNIVGTAANAAIGLFARTLNESSPKPQGRPVQAIRRSSALWAGAVAFFKAAASGIAKRDPAVQARKPSTLSFLHRSWHVPSPKPMTPAPKTWRIGFDRLPWPWKKRTRTSTLALPADPRLASALQPPRI
jgi:hypothetical protein